MKRLNASMLMRLGTKQPIGLLDSRPVPSAAGSAAPARERPEVNSGVALPQGLGARFEDVQVVHGELGDDPGVRGQVLDVAGVSNRRKVITHDTNIR